MGGNDPLLPPVIVDGVVTLSLLVGEGGGATAAAEDPPDVFDDVETIRDDDFSNGDNDKNLSYILFFVEVGVFSTS